MTSISTNNGQAKRGADDTIETIIETVRSTALDLITSLPEHPSRLRVQAAGVSVDLDWREPAAAPPPRPAEPAARQASPSTTDRTDDVTPEARPGSFFLCAPAVGTFYHAPEPGKPPFVEPDGLVAPGQQVGIIEAMKLMLPVEAERAGRVVSVLVPDGQAVQYGERLIELGPIDAG